MKTINPTGPADLLAAAGITFLRKWRGQKPSLRESEFRALLQIAADPKAASPFQRAPAVSPEWLAARYTVEPDFLLSFLLAMRRVWNRKGKRQAIQRWLCTAETLNVVTFPGGVSRPRADQITLASLTRAYNTRRRADRASEKDMEKAVDRWEQRRAAGWKAVDAFRHFKREV